MSDEQSVSQEDFLFGYSSWDSTNDCDQVEALKAAAECTYEVGMSEVSNKCHKCHIHVSVKAIGAFSN